MANSLTDSMANACAVCGANLDMVGRSHRCVPKPNPPREAAATITAQMSANHSRTVAVPPGAATYKYRDAAARRAYMREYMRKRRAS